MVDECLWRRHVRKFLLTSLFATVVFAPISPCASVPSSSPPHHYLAKYANCVETGIITTTIWEYHMSPLYSLCSNTTRGRGPGQRLQHGKRECGYCTLQPPNSKSRSTFARTFGKGSVSLWVRTMY